MNPVSQVDVVPTERPVIIGLVGGVASGKSTVARLLSERGAVALDADKMAHDALVAKEVRDTLVARWGETILNDAGQIDRAAVAQRVFGDSPEAAGERRELEAILHPRVRQQVESAIQSAAQAGVPAVVIDAPLLLEAGWGPSCDQIVLVDAPESIRRTRAEGRGWSSEEFARREAAQMPIEEKRASATIVIKNASGADELDREIESVWQRLVEPPD